MNINEIEKMTQREKQKNRMIHEIIMKIKASGSYVSGDTFLALAFRSNEELFKICNEIGICN